MRPVSSNWRAEGALSNSDICYADDGTLAAPLDVVEIQVRKSARRTKRQPENVLINEGSEWYRKGHAELDDVLRIIKQPESQSIFGNTACRMSEAELERLKINYSLTMVRVNNIQLNLPSKNSDYEYRNRRRCKAWFTYNGEDYDYFSVTDPEYMYKDGLFIENAYMVLSLPNKPYDKDGMYYKFIAKIFPLSKKEAGEFRYREAAKESLAERNESMSQYTEQNKRIQKGQYGRTMANDPPFPRRASSFGVTRKGGTRQRRRRIEPIWKPWQK